MQSSGHKVARSILRNSAALFVVGLFSKAMGLVLAVLVARFLGPDAMGLFAVLFSAALLTENIATLGLQDVLLREVAASPRRRRALWLHAGRLAALSGLAFAAGFLVAAWFQAGNAPVQKSLVAIAVGLPLSTVFGVSQALLQGMEEVLHLVWMTFVARLASLAWLAWALYDGAGVEAAFISRVLFLVLAVALFASVILRNDAHAGREDQTDGLLRSAIPLAANRGLTELSNRAPVLLMPGVLGLAATGIFDAADRFRQTLGMAVSVSITAVMPSFSRGFESADTGRAALVGQSIKFTVLVIGLVAIGLNVFAEPLVVLLYGPRFQGSVLLMQVLAWAHVVVAADAMVKQAMVAGRQEAAVPIRALVGTVALVVLVILLTRGLGTLGAAVAVGIAGIVTLFLDLRFTVRNVIQFDIWAALGKPFLCLGGTAVVLFALLAAPLWMRLVAAASSFLGLAVATRLLPGDERSLLWTMVTNRRPRQASMPAGHG